MPGRQDTEKARNYFGNLLLYDYLQTRRNPTFLRRNLQRAFDLHKEAIERAAGVPSPQTTGIEHQDRVSWRMPSLSTIQAQRQKRAFQLAIKAIKPTNEDGTLKTRHRTPSKKKVLLFRMPITVNASLWDLENGYKCYSHRNGGNLLGIETSQGKVASVDTDIITTTPDALELPNDSHNGRLRRQGLAAGYQVQVTIEFGSSVEVEDILSMMDVSLPPPSTSAPTRWRATYPNMLEFPEQDMLLPLTYPKGVEGRSESLGLGLEVSMRYTTYAGESLLSAANRQLKTDQRRNQSLPSRAAGGSHCDVEVTYCFLRETLTFPELRCAHCTHRIRQPFKTLDDLHMHLRSSHDLFQYKVIKEKEVNGKQYWRFDCNVADHKADQRASDRAPDPRDIQMIAPRRPFDQRAYLDEGNEDWQNEARLKRHTRPTISRTPTLPIVSTVSRKAPNEVQPRLKRQKELHMVPRAPKGVTFFRTLTKRPLKEGELISESDDNSDMEWLQSKTDSMIMHDPTLPEKVKRFLIRFNNYIREERLQDDVHVGEALVRFANGQQDWIRSEGLQEEFKKKITEFLEDQIISQEVHDSCIQIACTVQAEDMTSANHPTPPRTPLSPTHGSTVNKVATSCNTEMGSLLSKVNERLDSDTNKTNKGKAKVTLLGQTTPQTTDYDGDVDMTEENEGLEPASTDSRETASGYDECICGKTAFAHCGGPIIYCENDGCTRRTFHIDCVLKQWKPKEPPNPDTGDWYCRNCERNPDVDSGGQSRYAD